MKLYKIKKQVLTPAIIVTAIGSSIAAFAGLLNKNDNIIDSTVSDGSPQQEQTVNAELSGEQRSVPLYGFNGNNSKGPSWENKAFRDSVASLKFKIIRYPGGTLGDWWDWKKGWFINNENDSFRMPENLENINTHYSSTGLNELKLLVDQTGCDVVFTLNMITKSLDDQLDMLQNAQSLGIPVKWVELGNEYNNQENVGRKRFPTPLDYSKTSAQWIKAIKAKFPSAKIAVVGGNKQYSNDAKNWNNDVLKNAAGSDAIVGHLYPYATRVVDASGINFEMLNNEFNSTIDRQGLNKIESSKNIWITEYNILWSNAKNSADKDDIIKNAQTWGQALATLLMTSLATNISDKTQIILDHNISNTTAFAAIESENKTFRKLPNGIGMGEWLKVSNEMTSMRKISFNATNGNARKDYEFIGWKFSNANGKYSILVVNLTGESINLNTKSIANNGDLYFTEQAEKNKIINNEGDIKKENGILKNNTLDVPAYSVAIIKN